MYTPSAKNAWTLSYVTREHAFKGSPQRTALIGTFHLQGKRTACKKIKYNTKKLEKKHVALFLLLNPYLLSIRCMWHILLIDFTCGINILLAFKNLSLFQTKSQA